MTGTSTLRRETWTDIGTVAVARDTLGRIVTWSPVIATDGGEDNPDDEMAHITTRLDRDDELNIEQGETVHVTIERDDTGEEATVGAEVSWIDGRTIHLEADGKRAGHVRLFAGYTYVDEGSEINEEIVGHYALNDSKVGLAYEIEVLD